MEPHRPQAPSTDGALLVEPPLSSARELLAANRQRLERWDYDFQGRRASVLRPLVRTQVLDLAAKFLKDAGLDLPALPPYSTTEPPSLIVTGHQPELFHPGVWVKSFASALIARENGAVGFNLIVDNDVPKASDVKVPREVGGMLKVERVPFDDWQGEAPYEDLFVHDEALFTSFADRVRKALGGAVANPILDEFWPKALGFRDQTAKPGLRFALARHAVEASWGVRNVELPLSAVCESEGFLWFAAHLLTQLPRFQQIHNEALDRYRRLYHLRSRNHPVPALGREGDWLEAPFWVWRASAPRRHPLFIRQLSRTMQLRIGGENDLLAEIPLAPDREGCCAVEQLLALAGGGVRIRTRALTTTMFARYLLGDLFLHGIGGAKYDELGDAISGQFFRVEPPSYMTMSMTLWLGLPADTSASARLKEVNRQRRDLIYNPDRHLDAPGETEARQKAEVKRRAVASLAETRAEKIERFRAIRHANEDLQKFITERRAEVEHARLALVDSVRWNGLALSRDYASVLHSRSRLRGALERSLPGLRLE